MNYKGLLRSLDEAHETYVGDVLRAFDSYREWTQSSANGNREAVVLCDAEWQSARDRVNQQFHQATSAITNEDDPALESAQKFRVESLANIDSARVSTLEDIKNQHAASNARAFEAFNSEVSLARTNFNMTLIDRMVDNSF